MKKIKIFFLSIFLILVFTALNAQSPPHPNGGSAPGSGSTPVGGGAPIDGGLIILVTMGAAYGWRKAYDFRRRK